MADPIADSFLAGIAAPASSGDSIAASFATGYGSKVRRYPGDPISKIQERKAHPPPNARGSTQPEETHPMDYVVAAGEGLASMAPNVFSFDPVFGPMSAAAEAGKQTAAAAGASNSGVVRGVRMIAPAVPVIGPAVSDLLGPAQAVEANRPPTHEENVSAVRAGVGLAAQAAIPAALRVANVLRARGVEVPETSPPSAPIDTTTSEAIGPVESPPEKTSPAAPLPSFDEVPTATDPSPFRRKIVGDFVDEMRRRLSGEDRVQFTPEMSAVAKRLRFHLRGDDYLGFDTPREAIDNILQYPDFAERWEVSDGVRTEGNKLRNLYEQLTSKTPGTVATLPSARRGLDAPPSTFPSFDAIPTDDAADAEILARDETRRGGASPADFLRQQAQADQFRRTPEAAIARADLPLDEFVRQRFPRATLTEDRSPEWTQSILAGATDGEPGFSIEAAPDALKAEGVDRQLVYRDPDGKPIGVANVVDGEAGEAPLVRDFAVDKSKGLLAGRAVGAIATELDRAGAFEHMKEISPDAARFVQKAEARRAQAAKESPDDGSAPPSQPPPPNTPSSGGAPPPPPPPAIQAVASKPTPDPPPLPPVDDPQYAAALRTRYTGSVDVRALDGNHIAEWMKKTLTPAEQGALSIMRDEKGQPGSTQLLIDGTHPVYDEPGTSHAHVEAMRDVAELALNPTPAMRAADAVLDNYFEKTLKEGKERGVIDSSIESSDYIPHLLQPAEGIEPGRTGSPSGISETTPFALKRKNTTILEAMARGLDPRTINAADAVSIYARRHGLAMAAQILEDTLKESGIGKSITGRNVPEGWGEVGEGTRAFKRDIPYHDESGNLPDGSNHIAIAHQALYAPQKIVEALRPITEPNFMLKVPGWEATQRFQDYIKSSNVALAFFHLKAITVTAFNSMRLGPIDMMKAYMISTDDPFFMEAERNLVIAGGKTSAVARTAEAYRALEPTALPSRVDAIRNLPVMRQLDAAAAATSKLTFDLALRKTKVMDFASKDAAWIAQHPRATDLELAEARRSTARTLNANYGGLNWEALGVTRGVHAIMRAFMFAPDWTWSNVESVTQAFRGGPGGAQARWYMARSIAGGIGATAAMTYFISGKRPDQVPGTMKDRLFNVYLGDDAQGNHKFVNLFFAGAPNDAVNLAANVIDYGIGQGVGMSAATKANVLPRILEHTGVFASGGTPKDFMGRDIVPKGAGFVAGTALTIIDGAKEITPVPFGVKNAVQMVTDARHEYSPAEYAAAMLGGVRPRHVADHGDKVPITETKWVTPPEKNSTWEIITGKPVYKKR